MFINLYVIQGTCTTTHTGTLIKACDQISLRIVTKDERCSYFWNISEPCETPTASLTCSADVDVQIIYAVHFTQTGS